MPRVAKASSKNMAKKLANIEENDVVSSTIDDLQEVVNELGGKVAEEMASKKKVIKKEAGKGRGKKSKEAAVQIAPQSNGEKTEKDVKSVKGRGGGKGTSKAKGLVDNELNSGELDEDVATAEAEANINSFGEEQQAAENNIEVAKQSKTTGKGRNKKTSESTVENAIVNEVIVKPPKNIGKGKSRSKKEQPSVQDKEENGDIKEDLEEVTPTADEEVEKPSKSAGKGKGRNKKEQPSVPDKEEVTNVKEEPEEVKLVLEKEIATKSVGKGKDRKKKEQPSVQQKDELEATEAIEEELVKPTKAAVKTKGRKKKEPTPSEASKPEEVSSDDESVKKEVEITSKRPRGKRPATYKEEELESEQEPGTSSNKRTKKEPPLSSKPIAEKKKGGKTKVVSNEDIEDEENSLKPSKAQKGTADAKLRGRKRGGADAADEDVIDGAKPTKATKKATDSQPFNATNTNYNKADFELQSPENGRKSDIEELYNLKISSWNVAGLRSWLKKDGLKFLEYEEPDIFCLQEIKCTTDQLPEEAERIAGYHPYWLCMPGGYAGVAIYSKIMPINVEYGLGNEEFDVAGRIITAEYEKFYLINVYVPNSGRKLVNLEPRMRWEKIFQQFVQKLDERKPVIICGDMNVSYLEIDLANPKTNTRNAGFTKEERDKMSELQALGFVDTFRHLYPERTGAYTFWTYIGKARSRNVGWRLDYFLTSERIINRVVENCMRSQVLGSDHCPITLFLKL